MRFCVVVTGRNCQRWAGKCLASIEHQTVNADVVACVVDDASDDSTSTIVKWYVDRNPGWLSWSNIEARGAMANQWHAWHALEPADDDIVVWVDLDDRLASDEALTIVQSYYERGLLLTYGSYRAEPAAHPSVKTCQPARPYPTSVVLDRSFRAYARERRGGGLLYNHLRTVSGSIMAQITEADCQDDEGRWFTSSPDAAVMIPALELAGPRHMCITEVLYCYTADNPASEWRRWPDRVNADHATILRRPSKMPA